MSRSERKKQKKTKKKQPNKMGLGKKILLGILGLILLVGVSGLGLFAYYAAKAPELTEQDLTGTYAAELVDMNGEVFHTLGGEEREYAAADEYPEVLLDAVMAIEDRRLKTYWNRSDWDCVLLSVAKLEKLLVVGAQSHNS